MQWITPSRIWRSSARAPWAAASPPCSPQGLRRGADRPDGRRADAPPWSSNGNWAMTRRTPSRRPCSASAGRRPRSGLFGAAGDRGGAGKLALKRDIFARLDTLCDPQAIFATNTSGLSVNDIAQAVTRRDRFVGTPLLHAGRCDPAGGGGAQRRYVGQTVALVMGMLRAGSKRPAGTQGYSRLHRQPHPARPGARKPSPAGKRRGERRGHRRSRQWSLGIRLALSGPLEQRDMNGIDVHYAIASYLYQDLENRTTPSELLENKVQAGELGAKSGQGFCLAARAPRARAARSRAPRWPNWPPGSRAESRFDRYIPSLAARLPGPVPAGTGPTPRKRNALPEIVGSTMNKLTSFSRS